LGSSGEEELLLNELQPAQTQAPQADRALQFCKQRLNLLPLPLGMLELRCCPEVARSLPGCLVHVDSKEAKRSPGALRL